MYLSHIIQVIQQYKIYVQYMTDHKKRDWLSWEEFQVMLKATGLQYVRCLYSRAIFIIASGLD